MVRTLLLVLALAAAAWGGAWWARGHAGSTAATLPAGLAEISPQPAAKKHWYVCPMHPQIVRDHPDHCPICGMALVPVADGEAPDAHAHASQNQASHDEAAHDPATVTINAAVSNDLSVRVAPVERRDIVRRATLPAYVQVFTPGYTQAIRATLGGTLAHLVRNGSAVHAGDTLFEIDVPGALEAQRDYIALLQNKDEMAVANARNKLRELGMTGDDIAALDASHTPIGGIRLRATVEGRVANLMLHNGDTVHPGDTVLVVQGAGATTVDVDVFQTEALWLQSGDRAELRVRQFPGRVWVGQVSLQGMRTNPEKRTYGLTLVFPMNEGVLANDMFGEVAVTSVQKRHALAVPRDALIRTGHGSRVVVALGGGRFKPVDVKPGAEDADYVEILSGLKDSDRVVVSSQFLLDSESSQRAELERMTSGASH